MEEVIARMQDEKNGIPIRTVKSFLTKIPSVFSGKLLLSEVFFALFYLFILKKKDKTVNQRFGIYQLFQFKFSSCTFFDDDTCNKCVMDANAQIWLKEGVNGIKNLIYWNLSRL